MPASPTERELDPSRLKHLKAKLLAGLAIPFIWATARHEGKVIRVNGNHSSNMLCSDEVVAAWPDNLVAHIDEYEAPTADDLALLFRQFDDRKSGRSASDVSGAYQGLVAALRDIHRDVCKLGIEGIGWYLREIEGAPAPRGDDLYSLLSKEAYHPFLRWIGELFSIKTPELRRPQVVAAMYATHLASDDAREFWHSVARGGDDFDESAPATVLDAWLKELKEDADKRREIKPASLYQGCVFAYNAFRAEKPIKDIKHDAKKGYHEVAR